jgi:dihydrofolate reductase
MSKLRVHGYSISLDGYGAGPNQSLTEPLGVGGEDLHPWMVTTRTFQSIYGKGEGTTGVDDTWAAQGFENIGAWIMGRNMFAPSRGPWPDDGWKGWWGDNPVYHAPVFVLTHHARPDLAMEGGTTFHFVTDGIEAALERAREAAGARDVRLLGGAATIRQFLRAGLIDELHIAVTPMLLGSGESLFGGLDATKLGYAVAKHESTELATHVVLAKHDR